MKSQKEISLNNKLRDRVVFLSRECCDNDTLPLAILDELLKNRDVSALQDYANNVSINRLGYNDHGPVHMRLSCMNSLALLEILHRTGIKTSLESESAGSFSDSVSSIILASMLHDLGMTLGRKDHELFSFIISYRLIDDILVKLLPGDENSNRRTAIKSIAYEGIIGHMGTRPIHSIEAGVVLLADGCDMTKGRARIPLEINSKASQGDIHKYSAGSIESVKILPGNEKPIRIEVVMKESVGYFQVEEVLIPKIKASTLCQNIELFAGIIDGELKQYL